MRTCDILLAALLVAPVSPAGADAVQLSCTRTVDNRQYTDLIVFDTRDDKAVLALAPVMCGGSLLETYINGRTSPIIAGKIEGVGDFNDAFTCSMLKSSYADPARQHVKITENVVEFGAVLDGSDSENILDRRSGILRYANGPSAKCEVVPEKPKF
jgi:hypothetical protein